MKSTIVTIAEYLPSQRAQMLFYRSLLESQGIACLLSGELDEPSVGNVQLQVTESDAARARELMEHESPQPT